MYMRQKACLVQASTHGSEGQQDSVEPVHAYVCSAACFCGGQEAGRLGKSILSPLMQLAGSAHAVTGYPPGSPASQLP